MLSLHKQLSPCMVRMRIADLTNFPESRLQANLYDLDSEYTEQINAIYEEMDGRIKLPGTNELTELLRARQRVELIKVPLLVDLAIEAREENRAPVFFMNFTESREALVSALQVEGFTVSQIYGTQRDRDGEIDRFQRDEASAMVAMAAAGGVGVSLHATPGMTPRSSYITPSYNASELVQCLGRIHRANGTAVVQTIVLAAGTIEERVHKAIKAKLRNLTALNDGDLR